MPPHVPRDRCYDAAQHLWARRDAESGRVRVGLDALGLESLGELAYVALHELGATVVRGEPIGSLEAAKMTSTIVAPVSGELVARNDAVLRDPLRVNGDPYGDGWLVEIEATRWEAEAALLIADDAIEPWVTAELERLARS